MTLSAYLGEATGDDKYIKAAEKSLAWIRNINMKDNLALDSITAKDCKHGADWYVTECIHFAKLPTMPQALHLQDRQAARGPRDPRRSDRQGRLPQARRQRRERGNEDQRLAP